MEFVLIPAGSFQMGLRWPTEKMQARVQRSPAGFDGHPLHEVQIDAFYIATTEATVGQWRTFDRESKYKTTAERAGAERKWYRPEFKQDSFHPVVYISHEDAETFARWLSAKDGVTYRLPSEAEWEYACRGGSRDELPWGDDIGDAAEFANLAGAGDGYAFTAAVASFKPNAWGVYDMVGNAWEWCADWVSDDYYEHSPPANPRGPETGEVRAYRGGSWEDPLGGALPSLRNRQPSHAFYRNGGFRLIREAPKPPETRDQWLARAKPKWERITGTSLAELARVGEPITLDGIRWKVLSARSIGNRLSGRGIVASRTTSGRFIRVDMEIENLRKEPVTFLSRELLDSGGRVFETMSDAFWYFDENTVLILERINPNVPLRFVQAYEVPRDAKGLGITVSNLQLMNRKEGLIELGF
ncbi:MAG: SUMF1/EgtB/PvdO family nonheme iron enzyme [Phycisphaerae bacterium]|nr:SUMF1/EgtB/PvdO family nonheme iron enzyme [Phycisphaerae bacterium]